MKNLDHAGPRGWRRIARRSVCVVVAVALAMATVIPRASAHGGDDILIEMSIGVDDITGTLSFPETHVGEDTTASELAAAIRDGFGLEQSGNELQARITNVQHDASSRLWQADYWFGPIDPAAVASVRYTAFLDQDEHAFLLVATPEATPPRELQMIGGFTAGDEQVLLDLATGFAIGGNDETLQRWTPLASVELGFDHIRSGLDHMLFVAMLVLVATIQPAAAGDGSRRRHMAGALSAFTVGHGLSLGAVALNIVPAPPSRLIEVLIAATLVWMAFGAEPRRRTRLAVPLGFGIIHGAGFAGATSALIGVGASEAIKLVFFRHIGIELGQIVIALLVLVPIVILGESARASRSKRATLNVLGLIGVAMLLSRLLDLDLRLDRMPLTVLLGAWLFITAAALAHRARRSTVEPATTSTLVNA